MSAPFGVAMYASTLCAVQWAFASGRWPVYALTTADVLSVGPGKDEFRMARALGHRRSNSQLVVRNLTASIPSRLGAPQDRPERAHGEHLEQFGVH